MVYSTKILPEGDKYVGYALLNGEVVSTTKACNTAQQASLELEKFTKGSGRSERPTTRTNQVQPTYFANDLARVRSNTTVTPSVRRCCGRG
jgi:hypothetical protein